MPLHHYHSFTCCFAILLQLAFLSHAFIPQSDRFYTRQTRRYSNIDELINSPGGKLENGEPDRSTTTTTTTPRAPHLIFPGGGLFFYWQAGAVTYLREQGYDLSKVTASGASAGALTATLMATNVDFVKATELALQLSDDAGIWDRSGGLQGIWGDLIYEWMDQLLPENALEMVNHGKLSLLVTNIPSFGKTKVSTFQSRKDLIQCSMASVHLPWFLDGKLTANFRNQPHIDGSFLAKAPDYMPDLQRPSSVIRLDWNKDPAFQDGEFFDFIKVLSPEAIWDVLESGKEYARLMEEKGRFKHLPKLQ